VKGLAEALRQHRLAHLPMMGPVLRPFIAGEVVSGEHNRLRSLEQRMHVLDKQVDTRFARLKRRVATVGQVEAHGTAFGPSPSSAAPVAAELPERAQALIAAFRRAR
jgi:hypothetical protein